MSSTAVTSRAAGAATIVGLVVLLAAPTAVARPIAPTGSPGPSTPGTPAAATAGQRTPTKGPIGPNPVHRRKVPLNLLGGLIDGAPIFPGDFADPYLLAEPQALFIYATNTTTANVPVTRILVGDVFDGDYLGDALPTLPSWTAKGFQWAPSVWARPDGRFVLYYSTPAPPTGPSQPRKQCISRAVANAPQGPFTDDSSSPMICPLDQGGAIDPSPIVDHGRLYLLWKVDGNSEGLPTAIMSQPMSADGMSTDGPASTLITNDQPWEGAVVEGPSMVAVGGRHELFYSANNWDSTDYAVGIALCTTVTGPCTKPLDHAWMVSRQSYTGPGGQEFFDNPGGVWMVHHGFLPGQAGTPGGQRRLYLDLLDYRGADPIPTLAGAQRAEAALGKVLLLLGGIGALLVLAVTWSIRHIRRRHDTAAHPPRKAAP